MLIFATLNYKNDRTLGISYVYRFDESQKAGKKEQC